MYSLRAFQTDNTPVPCERWQFTQLPIRIGRNTVNEFSPQHPAVSGVHATIEELDGKLCIRDLGSRNGVWIPSGTGGPPIRVASGGIADLGPVGYRFYLSECVWVQLEFVQQEVAAPNPQAVVLGPNGYPLAPWELSAQPAPLPITGPPPAGASPRVQDSPVHDGPPQSQFFDMQLDSLALQGLRELARSLIPGHRVETTGDVARLITKLHDTLDVFCRSFVPLRQGYEQFVSSLGLARQQSLLLSQAATKIRTASSPEAVAAALLDPHDHTSDAPQAIEAILADLVRHQLALLDGVMQGVRALLSELSPQNIERALGQGASSELFGNKYRARWTEYCERYRRLSEEHAAFAVLFGQDFAEVYREHWHREGAKGQGGRGGSVLE